MDGGHEAPRAATNVGRPHPTGGILMSSTDLTPWAVDTAELLAGAERLRGAAAVAARHDAVLSQLVSTTDGWSDARSRLAATAFLDALSWAAAGAYAGLDDLARRTAAAGGAYERTEREIPFPR